MIWAQGSRRAAVLGVLLGGCAPGVPGPARLPAPPIIVGGAPPSGPPVLVLAAGLGAAGGALAFGSGFAEGTTIDGPSLAPGHSATTLVLSGTISGTTASSLSMIALAAVSSASLEPLPTYWRQGQRRGVTRPPSADLDRFGRFVTATSIAPKVAVEVDLGMRHYPDRRTDTVLAAFVAEGLPAAGRAFRLERHGGRFAVEGVEGPLTVLSVGSEVDPAMIQIEGPATWRAMPKTTLPALGRGRNVRVLGTVTEGSLEAIVLAPLAAKSAGLLVALAGIHDSPPLIGLPAPAPQALARHEPYSALLHRRFGSRPPVTAAPSARRAALRALFELGAPAPGTLLIRDDAGELILEDWALPTAAGTTGAMRVAYARSTPLPAPVLLYLCGHFPSGIRSPDVGSLLREGARMGFIVAAVDLMGHGLREGGEAGHVVAAYLTLAGRPALRMFLEEAEVAFETMAVHPAVDAARIGVAGVSMGGTLALHLAALSERVAAAVVVAGAPDFASYVRPIGSDAEQHTWRFAATSGLEGLPALIAPRPLSVVFAQHDPEHGAGSSEAVSLAGRKAFDSLGGRFEALLGTGLHDQGPATRRDVLATMARHLPPSPPPSGVPIGLSLPPAREPVTGFAGLVSQANAAVAAHANTRTRVTHDRLDGTAFAGAPTDLGSFGPSSRLYALPAGDPQLRTTLWHLPRPAPIGRVLVLDDGGRPAAVAAPLLARCGFEVFVAEPRTFGSAASWNEAWDRQLLALAAASLDRPLTVDVVRDVATAAAAAQHLAGAPIDAVLATGPEAGVIALLTASTGSFGAAHLVLGEAPAPYRWLLANGHPPYWSGLLPGLLAQTDLDLIAADLDRRARLTVTTGAPGLVAGTPPNVDPATSRLLAIRGLLARYGRADCVRRLPTQTP